MTEPSVNVVALLSQLGIGGVMIALFWGMWRHMTKAAEEVRARDIETYEELRKSDREFVKEIMDQVRAQAEINHNTAKAVEKASADLLIVTERLRNKGAL